MPTCFVFAESERLCLSCPKHEGATLVSARHLSPTKNLNRGVGTVCPRTWERHLIPLRSQQHYPSQRSPTHRPRSPPSLSRVARSLHQGIPIPLPIEAYLLHQVALDSLHNYSAHISHKDKPRLKLIDSSNTLPCHLTFVVLFSLCLIAPQGDLQSDNHETHFRLRFTNSGNLPLTWQLSLFRQISSCQCLIRLSRNRESDMQQLAIHCCWDILLQSWCTLGTQTDIPTKHSLCWLCGWLVCQATASCCGVLYSSRDCAPFADNQRHLSNSEGGRVRYSHILRSKTMRIYKNEEGNAGFQRKSTPGIDFLTKDLEPTGKKISESTQVEPLALFSYW